MVQDPLIEYISSQLKLGISRDVIKASLVGAGWAVADVEDTMKKLDGGPAAVAKPAAPEAGAPAGTGKAVAPASFSPFTVKSTDPKALRVSDLISAGDAPLSVRPAAQTISAVAKTVAPVSAAASAMSGAATAKPMTMNTAAPMTATAKPQPANPMKAAAPTEFVAPNAAAMLATKKKPILPIALGVLAAIFAGLAGFFFFQNQSLASKVGSLTTQSASVTQQLTTIKGQLTSGDGLTSQVAALTKANADLATTLSFYVAAPNASTTPTSTEITGMLSGGGKTSNFILTTPYGAKLSVANSRDAKVAAALAPLVGATSTVTFGITFTPGLPSVTVTSVNGAPLQK